MKELHIPFGISKTNRQIIEPEDAERGRACNCLCPGCEAPLLSRHPQNNDKRIHFAHDSKHPDAKPLDDCPLSPFVSLGMMLRHLSNSLAGKPILFTAYSKTIIFDCCSAPRMALLISEEENSIIDGCSQSVAIGGVVYDLMIEVNGKSYFVELIYPNKNKKDLPAPEHLKDIGGIFCVSGPEFLEMMSEPEFMTARYSDSVAEFLNRSRKFWAFHHLEIEKEPEYRNSHTCVPHYHTKYRGHQAQRGTTLSIPYSEKYSTYKAGESQSFQNAPIYNTTLRDAEIAKAKAAEAYRRASRGEGGTVQNVTSRTLDQSGSSAYRGQERSYLLPPAYHSQELTRINTPSLPDGNPPSGSNTYECMFCSIKYEIQENCPPSCPKCHGHLGARLITE